MTDRRIDEAIDRAVREMVSIDAAAGLRSRVLTRLETSAPHAFPWLKLAAGSALTGVVLAVFVLVKSRDAAIGLPPPERPGKSVGLNVRPGIRTPPPGPTQAARPDRVKHPREVAAAVADLQAEPGHPIVVPLPAIDPITIVPLEAESFAPTDLSVAPLSPIVELRIQPLSPSDGRE